MELNQTAPAVTNIVLLGGGHAHVEVLRQFGMNRVPEVNLTLLSAQTHTAYSGMLPGYLARHYSYAESHLDLLPLSQFAGAQFYRDRVVGLDLARRRIHCARRSPVAFDLLSINTGSTPRMAAAPGAERYAIPIKPVESFLRRWAEIERELIGASHRSVRFLIVGGGAGGVELSLSLQHRLQQRWPERFETGNSFRFAVAAASPEIMPTHNVRVRRRFRELLAVRGIELFATSRVVRVEPDRAVDDQGRTHRFDYLFWVTEAAAPKWLREAGLEVDKQGFAVVDDRLRSVSHPEIFAAGDVASFQNRRCPKSGVYAVRQGGILARNLRYAAGNEPLVAYRPQRKFLSLISTGAQHAVASRGRWAVQGRWVWRLKDWIDRRWMRRYRQLPAMREADDSHGAGQDADGEIVPTMRCAGCGAKIGRRALTNVLGRLPNRSDRSIAVGLEVPDDAAVFSVRRDASLVQSVDHLPSFINDPYLFGQIAAVHCLSDILAMGAEPHSAQIVAVVPFGRETVVEELLFQTLSGAVRTLDEHQTALIGGHSSEGERLALGMTINGLLRQRLPWRKGNLRPDDRLILTKPLGSGILLAAFMRRRCPGRWLDGAVDQMVRSHASAVPVLRKYGAEGVTDCTGFGLIGHLAELIEASGVDAALDIDRVPIMEGAASCAERGIVSSLYPQNLQREATIVNCKEYRRHPHYPALFDPQTSGGLLFGIGENRAAACLRELRELGWDGAAAIGAVTKPAGRNPKLYLR